MKISSGRRAVLKAGVGLVASGILPAAAMGQGAPADLTGRPNIIYILADDLGYADLGCYGRRDYATPNIDRLAAEGMLFTDAYANSAVCSATRIGLITGRYQYRLAAGLRFRRPPARSAHDAPAIARRGVSHDPDWQVAHGRPARLRPAEERL